MRGGKAGTPGRRVVVVGAGGGGGGQPKGAKTLSDRFKALEKKGGGPTPGGAQRNAQNVQRTADKRFSKVMAKRTGNAAVAPKKAVPVAGGGGSAKKTPKKGKGVPVGAASAKKGARKGKGKPAAGAAKPSKELLDSDLDTYMKVALAPAAPDAAAAPAPMAE